jgi:hypothetical protein
MGHSMTPERRVFIGDQKIEEYYWNGDMVVYVNNRLFEGSYEDAVIRADNKFHADFALIVEKP